MATLSDKLGIGTPTPWANISATPTTLAGYGITDAATAAQGANADTAHGWGNHAIAGYLTTVSFAGVTGKPTTLAGYGITDAATAAQGANADTALQTGDDISGSGLTSTGKVVEQTYSLSGTVLNPDNGTIQTKTLSANTTFTESLANGEYITLLIDDGSSRTITWPTMTWVGGVAPTLQTTGFNVIEIWKTGGVLYGAYVGAT